MTPRRFKCSQFRKGILDFNFECIRLLQNDFCKQRYITLNATISAQDRIYPKTHLCRTFHYANMSVQYTAIFHSCKNDNFQMKFFDIFLIFAQKIDCWYTLEPPLRGGSNGYPQSMFWSKNKKNMYTRVNPTFSI